MWVDDWDDCRSSDSRRRLWFEASMVEDCEGEEFVIVYMVCIRCLCEVEGGMCVT